MDMQYGRSGIVCACVLMVMVWIATNETVTHAANEASGEAQIEELVSLARSGKNVEAISLYNALPENTDVPLVAMRAVAGCYWRERQFDKSRELYQEILDRRPTLHRLSKKPVETVAPLLAKDEETDTPESAEPALPTEPTEPAAALAVDSAATEKLQSELDALRTENTRLAEEREQLRKETSERIAHATAAATLAIEEVERLRAELAEVRERDAAASGVSEQIQSSLETQGEALNARVGELEHTLEVARAALDKAQVERQTEAESMALALADERELRENAEKSATSVQDNPDGRGVALSDEVTALEGELDIARAALTLSNLELDGHLQQGEARAKEMADRVALLESQTLSARSDADELGRALEAARLHNAELSAAKVTVTDRAESQVDDMEASSLRCALSEIDTLEREYQALDASAAKRQHALLMRIDALEQASVMGGSELEDTRQLLEIERALRTAMEAQGDKRDEALLTANRVLAEAAQNMAVHFDAIRSQIAGNGELRIRDDSKRPADLAPLIGKLEAATESAATEVKELRDLLAEERKQHEQTKAESVQEIADLRRSVEVLTLEIESLKAASVKRETELQAEADQRVADVSTAAEEREALLRTEIEALGEKISRSAGALEAMKQELVADQAAHSEVLAEAGTVEKTLRERIRDLELAFELPNSVDAAPVVTAEAGDAKLSSQVQDLYDSILETAQKDKALALTQFESLPEGGQKPLSFLKPIANLYREKQRYEVAYGIYEEILARAPGNLYAERKLVMTLFDMGRYDEALERLAGPQAKAGDSITSPAAVDK